MVFATHSVPARHSTLARIAHVGDMGLSLFFVLSSFLITELLLREKERTGTIAIGSFYIRRVLRIWPLMYCFLGFTSFLSLIGTKFQADQLNLLAMALFVGNWYTGRHGFTAGVSFALWSISVEEQFYVLWPLLCRVLSKQRIVLVSLLTVPVAAGALLLSVRRGADPVTSIWTNTFVQFQMFGLGAMLAVLLHGKDVHFRVPLRLLAGAAGGALLCAGTLVFHIRDPYGQSAGALLAGYLCAGLGSCLLLFATLGVQVAGWMRPAVYLGKISYGLYVFHILCLTLTIHIFSPSGGTAMVVGKVVFALGLTCVLAMLSYTFLESPFIRLKDKFAIVKSRAA